MKRFKQEKAFTLVELLVVLAIIGILIGLAVGGIRIVQQVNRDTQRKALVRDIQLALESYNEKHNGYPQAQGIHLRQDTTRGVVVICACLNAGSCNTTCTGGEKVESKANFLPEPNGTLATCSGFPASGPETNSGRFRWCYQGTARAYTLNMLIERSTDIYQGGNS